MKRTEAKSIAEIIDESLRASNLDRVALEHRASYLWSEVMGPGVTRYTSRRYVAAGVMHVYITSAPLKNELTMMQTAIVKAINDAVGEEIISAVQFH